MADACSCSVLVARRRTVKVAAALKVALTEAPVAGWAPPSKFQRKPSPVPLPLKLAVVRAVSEVGPLVMVPFGSVRPTVAVCEDMRRSWQAEKGWNWLAGIDAPLRLTASVLGSTVHSASSRTLAVVLVTTAPATGVGAMNRSGPGAGFACAGGGAERAQRRRPGRTERRAKRGIIGHLIPRRRWRGRASYRRHAPRRQYSDWRCDSDWRCGRVASRWLGIAPIRLWISSTSATF